MNLKSAVRLAIAVSVLGAAPAMATSVTPPSAGPASSPTSSTGSGLMVQVWDTSTDFGFVEWLGNTYQSFSPGGTDGATTLGTTYDYGVLDAGGWSAFMTAAGTDTVDFNVVATNSPGGGVANTWLTTGPDVLGWTTGKPTSGATNNAASHGVTYLGSTGSLYQNGNCNPCNSTKSTDPAFGYLTSSGGGAQGTNATTAVVGSTLGFYKVVAGSGLGAPTITQYASGSTFGTWTLSTSGDLVYAFGSAVPLPAAGWLLVSGLMGLVGVGRRRRVLAA